MEKSSKKEIPTDKLLTNNKQINIIALKEFLSREMLLSHQLIKKTLMDFRKIIANEPNVIYLNDPIKIVGDIHGQFFDLLKILSLCGSLDDNPKLKILFLGDYVDRGINGTQVITLLITLKIKYPKQIYLLRGNHQSRQMTQSNNFHYEFLTKYSQQLYDDVMNTFDLLPLASVVNNQYFCVHGGIPPQAEDWDDPKEINMLDRFLEIPFQGQMCDLIWADPSKQQTGKCKDLFEDNESRGCSIYFGAELSHNFLKRNKLSTIIRAHQIINQEGYKKHIWPGWNDIPTVITIFSAPNYCGTFGNKAVVLSIQANKIQIRQFNQQSPSLVVPQKINAFSLSIPIALAFINKFVKKTVDKHFNKLVPGAKALSAQQKISLILLYINKQNKKLESNDSLISSKAPLSKIQQQSQFQRSVRYFADKERKPNIFNSKVQKCSKQKIQNKQN